MKLSQWAKLQGLHYRTAYNWFKAGKLPVKAYQSETGTIVVENNNIATTQNKENIVIYCRVSNHDRRDELEYQVNRCSEYCKSRGYIVNKIYKEVASGMNDNRLQFWKMVDSQPTKIIVENKDRLTRFGFNYLEILLPKLGCEIEVMNREEEDEKDLVKDMVAIMTSFCCRLYGLRRGQNKSKKIKEVIDDSND